MISQEFLDGIAVVDCVASLFIAGVGSVIGQIERNKIKKEKQAKKEALEIVEKMISEINLKELEKKRDDFQELLNKEFASDDKISFDGSRACLQKEKNLIEGMKNLKKSFEELIENELLRKSRYFTRIQTQIVMNIIEKYRYYCNTIAQCDNFMSKIDKSTTPDAGKEESSKEEKQSINIDEIKMFFAQSVRILNEAMPAINSLNEELYLLKLTFGSESIQKLSKTE